MPRRLRPTSARISPGTALLLCLVVPWPTAVAVDPQDFAVQVTAQVQTAPAQIALQWPPSNFATGYTLSRKLPGDQSWTPLASLPAEAVGFTDSTVVPGGAYEYEIAETASDGLNAYGYIQAGLEVPFPGSRGRVILVVDSTYASDLSAELTLLTSDLIGDGWTVQRHDVPRSSLPADVKTLIRNDYNADPANTTAVFLFGHVPVPYSGDINPDMHPTHRGAWPADAFYGDMDGTWTDDSVYDTSSEDPRNYNVPGDGKFDQSDLPARVALQVGRVDLADLPSFAPSTELELLRQYLNKNHRYRHKLFDVARRGLLRDNFGEIDGDAPATDAWRVFPPFFGPNGIDVIGAGSFFPTLASQSYLFAYGGGGGEYYQADGVGSTTDFASQSPQCVFYMLDGSYFGDWDSTDNFLRAALASSGYGLVAAWTGLPHWFLHPMALGETIGSCLLLTQNNLGLYKNQVNFSVSQVHIALMGDPTLRMHVVAPPGNLTATPASNGAIDLSWAPSPDNIQGYYLYRASSPLGPFARVNRSFITGTSFTDPQPPAGPQTYMVRAVKLEISGSGTYYNPSQGAFSNASSGGGGGGQPAVVQIEALNPSANESGPVEGDFVISRSGPTDSALTVEFTISGSAINGTDYEPISNSVQIPVNSSAAWVAIHPLPDNQVDGNETVTLTLLPSSAYSVGAESSATVTILDAHVDQPPAISSIANITMAENGSSPAISFSVSDPDTPAANLSASANSSNSTLIPSAGLSLSGTGSNRTLTITPAADQTGTATVTVTVSDGTLSTSVNFQVTILGFGRISSIQHQANGAVLLSFDGSAGHAYNIQQSPDLLSWTTINSGIAGSTAPVSYLDSQPPAQSCRFYRIQWQ